MIRSGIWDVHQVSDKASPQEEAEMMRQATAYLAYHNAPPSMDSPESGDWWTQAMAEAAELDSSWNGHSLIRNVLFALIDYIESKVKEDTEAASK